MVQLKARRSAAFVLMAGLALGGCQSGTSSSGFGSWFDSSSSSPPPPPAAGGRPSVAASDIIGRWGIASYHRDADRARTETAAQGQCRQPYVISGGQAGGVMMLNHDSPNIVEHSIKASAEGKTYVGPGSQPGAADDREVVSFDGRVLILRWVDPEVAGRYGTMVLVRCGAEGARPPARTSSRPAPASPPPPR
ncbi:MAG TPA: hypothetical protein VM867_02795 [Xanthobacteraceae bacterium]|jgi:hypothetical protein|nr:hypothetical protein [Xanthobacteraceae bacterium]